MRRTKSIKKLKARLDPKVRTFFLISSPTLLIIALAMINPQDTWWAWILIAVYQFIMLKQFVDQYHEVV